MLLYTKRKSERIPGGSNSSNNSLHDDTDSIISIHNAKPEVNENEDLAEPNITEYSLSPVDDSGRELMQEQRKKTSPNLGDKNTVFAEGNGRSYSISETTEGKKLRL